MRLDAAHYLTTALLLRIRKWCAAWRRLVDLSFEMDKCQNDYGMVMILCYNHSADSTLISTTKDVDDRHPIPSSQPKNL